MRKLDNRGFSLVELLVAVLVLAIVTVPLLRLYVSSAQMAAKSREAGDLTNAAQNIVEVIQARSVHQVLPQGSSADFGAVAALFGSDSAEVTLDEEHGGGTLTLAGISSGNQKFDAVIELNPQPYQASVNDKEITQYTAMDGVYQQIIGDLDVDEQAIDQFNQDYSYATLKTRSRAIRLSVEENDVVVQFTYTFGYEWTETVGEASVTRFGTRTIPMPESSLFSEGLPEGDTPFSVYLFFNPYYESTSGLYHDQITINNPKNLKCNIFLVKQDTNPTSEQENNYRARLNLMEKHAQSEEDPFKAAVFSNIGQKLKTGGTISGISYRKYFGPIYYKSGSFGEGALIDKQKENRLYNVSVALYPPGKDELMLTFQATKLQ